MKAGKTTFKRLQRKDLPLMHRWLNTPHVSEWWNLDGNNHPSLEEVSRHFSPRIEGKDPVDVYMIIYNDKPIGMVQSCKLDDFPMEKANFGLDRSCVGIDIFIGEESYVHHGLGSGIIREFLKNIVFEKYNVDCCIVDPYVENEIAIKAYKKAGFKYLKTVWYEKDGRREHLLSINRDELKEESAK
ncbi:MAG: GNAT family N-acetyltransferase [Dehalococcoidales bacterium]